LVQKGERAARAPHLTHPAEAAPWASGPSCFSHSSLLRWQPDCCFLQNQYLTVLQQRRAQEHPSQEAAKENQENRDREKGVKMHSLLDRNSMY
jgi:hypothetical protein